MGSRSHVDVNWPLITGPELEQRVGSKLLAIPKNTLRSTLSILNFPVQVFRDDENRPT